MSHQTNELPIDFKLIKIVHDCGGTLTTSAMVDFHTLIDEELTTERQALVAEIEKLPTASLTMGKSVPVLHYMLDRDSVLALVKGDMTKESQRLITIYTSVDGSSWLGFYETQSYNYEKDADFLIKLDAAVHFYPFTRVMRNGQAILGELVAELYLKTRKDKDHD